MSDLKHVENENVLNCHGLSEQESEQFTVVQDGVQIVMSRPLIMAATRRQYTPSEPSECSALELIVRKEKEKDLWHDFSIVRETRRSVQEHVR